MLLADVATALSDVVSTVIFIGILKWLLILGITGTVLYFVIREICKYAAKKNAEEFDYDYLAERTAAEICKRMIIIEKQRQSAHTDSTGNADKQIEHEKNVDTAQDEETLA